MIYFDASALMKLIAPEPESAALSGWIGQRSQQRKMTSAVSKVQVLRAFRAMGPAAEDLASIIVSKVDMVPVEQDVLDAAATLPGQLDALAAIHLASARTLSADLLAYVSYDTALLCAAEEVGLSTASPGAQREPSLA